MRLLCRRWARWCGLLWCWFCGFWSRLCTQSFCCSCGLVWVWLSGSVSLLLRGCCCLVHADTGALLHLCVCNSEGLRRYCFWLRLAVCRFTRRLCACSSSCALVQFDGELLSLASPTPVPLLLQQAGLYLVNQVSGLAVCLRSTHALVSCLWQSCSCSLPQLYLEAQRFRAPLEHFPGHALECWPHRRACFDAPGKILSCDSLTHCLSQRSLSHAVRQQARREWGVSRQLSTRSKLKLEARVAAVAELAAMVASGEHLVRANEVHQYDKRDFTLQNGGYMYTVFLQDPEDLLCVPADQH